MRDLNIPGAPLRMYVLPALVNTHRTNRKAELWTRQGYQNTCVPGDVMIYILLSGLW